MDLDSARAKDTQLLNENYLTSTGETVPRPGLSQGTPTTSLDRRIEKKQLFRQKHLQQLQLKMGAAAKPVRRPCAESVFCDAREGSGAGWRQAV